VETATRKSQSACYCFMLFQCFSSLSKLFQYTEL